MWKLNGYKVIGLILQIISVCYGVIVKPEIWLKETIVLPLPHYRSIRPSPSPFSLNPEPSDFGAIFRYKNNVKYGNISKSGNDYTINDRNIRAISFACQANYPIQWRFPHPEHFAEVPHDIVTVQNYRTSTFTSASERPDNMVYRSYLILGHQHHQYSRFYKVNFLSANITCESVDVEPKKTLKSSVHIFWNAHPRDGRSMANDPYIFHVSLSENVTTNLTLPCRPVSPNITVILEKRRFVKDKDAEWRTDVTWDPFPLSDTLTFNPKLGFTFSTNWSAADVVGFYRCVGQADNSTTFVDVHAGGNPGFQPRFHLDDGASFWWNASNMECCTGSASGSLSFFSDSCSSPLECDLMKRQSNEYFEKIAPRSLRVSSNSSVCVSGFFKRQAPTVAVYCRGKDVEVKLELIRARTSPFVGLGRGVNMSPDRYFVLLRTFFMQMQLIPSQNTALSKVLSELAPESFRTPNKFGVLQETNLYEGETSTFMCMYSKFLYANGTHLRLNWKNGTKTVLEMENHGPSFIKSSKPFEIEDYNDEKIGIFSKPLVASTEMESVDCYVPTWNTSEWKRTSYSLNVIPSIPPKFSGNDETIQFTLHDTNRSIQCEVVEGVHVGEIEITKDGRALENSPGIQITGNGEGDDVSFPQVVVTFPRVNFEVAGVYQCKAKNGMGVAVKNIKIVCNMGN